MTFKEALDRQNCVRIPVWVVTIIVTLVIALSGFTWSQASTQSRIISTLENQGDKLNKFETSINEKASRAEVVETKAHLIRIEDKLDRLIERAR